MNQITQQFFLCRTLGSEEWHKIDSARVRTAEEAAEAYSDMLDKTPVTRFVYRTVEVQTSDSANISRYSVALDWNVGYSITRLTEDPATPG